MSKWKEFELGTVIQTNQKSIDKSYPHQEILYLDTGSITRGKIDSFEKVALNKAPSRARRLVKNCDIIYSSVRPIQRHFGYIQYPQDNLIVSTGFVVITCDQKVLDPKFVYYYLSSDAIVEELDIIAEASTSTYPSLKPSDIEKLKVYFPTDVNEQNSIASILTSLDDKIDLLHRQNKTLEAMAETLFRQWFVEGAGGEFAERPLSSIANFLNGLACQKFPPKNEVDKLPVLKIKELSSGISESSDWASTDIKQEYIVNHGDVIFAWSASLMVKVWNGKKCILNQHLFKVTSEEFPKWFYLMWCKHHLAEFISISSSHATTMGHIKRGDLDSAVVLVPKAKDLEVMSNKMTPLLEKQISIAKQIDIIETIRDILLPKLMSGEVRVLPYV